MLVNTSLSVGVVPVGNQTTLGPPNPCSSTAVDCLATYKRYDGQPVNSEALKQPTKMRIPKALIKQTTLCPAFSEDTR